MKEQTDINSVSPDEMQFTDFSALEEQSKIEQEAEKIKSKKEKEEEEKLIKELSLEGLIIDTDINTYGFTDDEKFEMDIEIPDESYSSEEVNDYSEELEMDDYEQHLNHITDNSSITGSDNNYQENNEKISFHAEASYQDNYCQDVYNSEEFYLMKFLRDRFQEELKELIHENPQYAYLKSYDTAFLEEGDTVFYLKEKEPYYIQYIFSPSEIFICKKDNSAMKFCAFSQIRPFDKVISEFNKNHKVEIYVTLNRRINDRNANNVEFFSIFCEYFKMDEATLYKALPEDIQNALKKQLYHRSYNR